MSSVGRMFAVAGVAATLPAAPIGTAQQVLEIDFTNGRSVIDDHRRAIRFSPVAVDHSRRAMYVRDLEEPDGIMVFSLDTGEWLRTYHIVKGEGPRELRDFRGFTLASKGGLYILGAGKALQLDSLGGFIGYWQFGGPATRAICEFDGQPAVGVQGGLKRRGASGGEDKHFGGPVVSSDTWARTPGLDWSEVLKWRGAQLACRQDAGYLVLPHEGFEAFEPSQTVAVQRRVVSIGPDSIRVYHADGRESRLTVPTEFAEDHAWNRNLKPSIDAQGALVLTSRNGYVPGAVVDPETGCYGVFRNREYQMYREFVGIHNDSALVFHRDREQETRADGKRVVTLYSEARTVSLNPIRRVSGEPCPGMLPSVGGDNVF